MRSQTKSTGSSRGGPPKPLALLLAAGLGVLVAPHPAAAQGAPPTTTDAPAVPSAPTQATPAPTTKPLSESLSGMAKAEYEAGRILYADKDFGNAIVKFQKAHEISGDPRLLWNMAVCEKNLRRYGKMLRTIRRYRHEAAALLTEEERVQAVEIIKTVETFVSALKLTTSEPGAEVFVDDESLGTTPLAEPLLVDVGVRRIRVVKAGYKPVALSREIVGGGEVAIDVPLEKEIHRGRVQVVAGPEDLIALDGKAVGLSQWEGSAVSGGHTLRVTAPGMTPYQSEVVLQDDQLRRVEVTLTPLPRTDTARTVLWIVGGAVLAAGASVGGYFLFKPQTVTPVAGSLPPGSTQLSFGSGGISFGGRR